MLTAMLVEGFGLNTQVKLDIFSHGFLCDFLFYSCRCFFKTTLHQHNLKLHKACVCVVNAKKLKFELLNTLYHTN